MEPNLRLPAVILLIDDQATPLSCRTLLLQSEGYSVLTASSAEEGLKVFRENHVDLVMSDHLLGSATGTEVAAEMKQIKPDVPVIIYSGVIEIPEGAECADLFLSKTEPVAIMLQQISDVLKRRHAAATGK
jgi:DNA-binding NtrC family response regulator